MRKLLLFFAMLCVSVGTWAADFEWTSDDGQYTVTASDVSVGGSDTYQKLVVNKAGALAAFVEATKGDANNVLMGVGGNASRVNLQIEGALNSADFSALNSTEVARWGTFTSLDMKNATIDNMAVITGSSMNMGNLKYMRLPSNLTDVNAMESLKTRNASLDLVLSISDLDTDLPKTYINSFTVNSIPAVSEVFKNGNNGFEDLRACKYVTMTGTYGERDLVDGTSKNFGTPAVWDFTGASFSAYMISSYTFADGAKFDDNTDPFAERNTSKSGVTNYPSNSFYFFSYYSKAVVDITLPTAESFTSLPPNSLQYLGTENKANYMLVNDLTEAEYSEISGTTTEYAPIEKLVIPDNIVTMDYECAIRSKIVNLFVGNGVKNINGGAFANSVTIENLDFKAGINNCRIGSNAFQECNKMKHIVLSEGIVSLGSYCFDNSQNLESIRLPETLRYIGNFCFKNGHALSSITIPENVEKIGKGAFQLTALTDVYLTTTNPEKIPEIFTAGGTTAWPDWENSTFSLNQLYGNNAIPYDAAQAAGFGLNQMTWDEAVEWYYSHANLIAQLHYPEELADMVMAYISDEYGAKTADECGIPVKNEAKKDQDRRATGDYASEGDPHYMGDSKGRYSKYGWGQFLLMKEYVPNKPGNDVYTKEYDDVWYTMCFPFDLTDEQLAAAFNEGFNIADFSGVEIKDKTDESPKTMILHFNTVAKTTYKDLDGNIYTPTGVREKSGAFEYNVYTRNGQTYKHVLVGKNGFDDSGYKTKNFAVDGNAENEIVMIDGILATAGHPYMVHPNTGTNTGMPLTRCHFSGIKWKPAEQWETIFNAEKRVVDLGVAKGTIGETLKDCTPSPDNYLQAAYPDHDGETYTFIGNWKQYRDGAEAAVGPEPEILPMPSEVVIPDEPTPVAKPEGEPMEEPESLTPDEQGIYSILNGIWGSYDEITCSYNDNSEQWSTYNSLTYLLAGKYGLDPWNDAENCFNTCKNTFNKAKNYTNLYRDYLANKALWDAYYTYLEDKDYYDNFDLETETAKYNAAVVAHNNSVTAHEDWESRMNSYKVLIPTYSYFLGRRGRGWPKFYREMADDTRTDATGGFWTQFTAVVKPNAAALAGLEAQLDGKTQQAKGSDMVFVEGFLNNVISQDQAATLIENAQEEGAKVEYMNIVVSINGQVVRRGSTSLEGLPRGMYIINGKKYFVK